MAVSPRGAAVLARSAPQETTGIQFRSRRSRRFLRCIEFGLSYTRHFSGRISATTDRIVKAARFCQPKSTMAGCSRSGIASCRRPAAWTAVVKNPRSGGDVCGSSRSFRTSFGRLSGRQPGGCPAFRPVRHFVRERQPLGANRKSKIQSPKSHVPGHRPGSNPATGPRLVLFKVAISTPSSLSRW